MEQSELFSRNLSKKTIRIFPQNRSAEITGFCFHEFFSKSLFETELLDSSNNIIVGYFDVKFKCSEWKMYLLIDFTKDFPFFS